jgi:tetratricopeptide (TPR) repeat protein
MKATTLESLKSVGINEGNPLSERLDRLAERLAMLAHWLTETAESLTQEGAEQLVRALTDALDEFVTIREQVLKHGLRSPCYEQDPHRWSPLKDLRHLIEGLGITERADGERCHVGSLNFAGAMPGSDDPETADYMANLAVLHHKQGKYADAEDLHQRALLIRERSFGCEHPKVASSLNNLAMLYRDQGRISEAQKLWERSLAIVQKVFGPEHPKTGLRLSNLGGLFYGQGDYKRAEEVYQRLLTILRKKRMKASTKRVATLRVLTLLHGSGWGWKVH